MNGKNEDITRKDLETVARNNDIHDYKSLIDLVTNAATKLETYAKELDIDKELIKSIKTDFIQTS